MRSLHKLLLLAGLCVCLPSYAMVTVTMQSTTDPSKSTTLGTISFQDTSYGLLIQPNLQNLPAGLHGFHLHVEPSCDNHGNAAGGHYDPEKSGKHLGPYNTHGHLGDLPALFVDSNGNANLPNLAPRLSETDLLGHALMIHANGDNYSDQPPMGGGGDRIACGVITVAAKTPSKPVENHQPKMPIQ